MIKKVYEIEEKSKICRKCNKKTISCSTDSDTIKFTNIIFCVIQKKDKTWVQRAAEITGVELPVYDSAKKEYITKYKCHLCGKLG